MEPVLLAPLQATVQRRKTSSRLEEEVEAGVAPPLQVKLVEMQASPLLLDRLLLVPLFPSQEEAEAIFLALLMAPTVHQGLCNTWEAEQEEVAVLILSDPLAATVATAAGPVAVAAAAPLLTTVSQAEKAATVPTALPASSPTSKPMPYIDHKGLTWTRSDDLRSIKCEDGRSVIGNPEMTDDYLVSVAYLQPTPEKTDAERIAELEAQLAALISKLSSNP